jgi:VWFA-related protein
MRFSTTTAKPANLLLIGIAWVSAFPAHTAFSQQTTLRSQANVVVIPALVKDAHGEIVYGLEAKDFIVEDDSVQQAVRLDEAPEGQPVSLVVAIQTGRRAAYELPRERGLNAMLDPIFASDTGASDTATMDTGAPGTARVALVEFDSQVKLVQEFTNNEAAIEQGLKNVQPGDGGAAILDAITLSVNLLKQESDDRLRVLLLICETRDHGSSSKIQDAIAHIGQANVLTYALAFSPALSNILDTERGNNNPNLHPEQSEMHPDPDLLAPFVLAVEAMRKNVPSTVASMTGGEYELFSTRKKFDRRMTDFTNHIHNRYLLSIAPKDPHPGLHQLHVRLRNPTGRAVLARISYWAGGTAQ